MSSPGQPPAGWDEPDDAAVAGARVVRQNYLAMIAVGFTMDEATSIIAKMIALGGNGPVQST